MAGSVDNFIIVKDTINANFIRSLSGVNDDETLRIILAVYICDIAGGLMLPTKKHKVELAKEMIKRDIVKEAVLRASDISEATYYKIKMELGK